MAKESWIRESIMLRNTYVDPLHILQAELLHRVRHQHYVDYGPLEGGLRVV